MFRTILTCFILVSSVILYGGTADKYRVYAYVFSEFDVDEAYIYDSEFETFVKSHEKSMRTFYRNSLKRGEIFLPMVTERLMDEEISDLFIYLSMVESGFSPFIVSPKKAVGLWQFMPGTAKRYNLDIDHRFDERCDPCSSTHAAIAYLKKLYKQFGKWYLAALAYNCGEGRLEKAIKKCGSNELAVLIDNDRKLLPKETREYIKKILLLAMIGESKALEFSDNSEDFVQVQVDGGTDLKELAVNIEMNTTVLLKLNRQFKEGIVPNTKDEYNITIPYKKIMAFYLSEEHEVKRVKSNSKFLLSHYVQMGETLESIAKEYNCTIEAIRQTNRLGEEFLMLGKLLIIPVNKKTFHTIKGKIYAQ